MLKENEKLAPFNSFYVSGTNLRLEQMEFFIVLWEASDKQYYLPVSANKFTLNYTLTWDILMLNACLTWPAKGSFGLSRNETSHTMSQSLLLLEGQEATNDLPRTFTPHCDDSAVRVSCN